MVFLIALVLHREESLAGIYNVYMHIVYNPFSAYPEVS